MSELDLGIMIGRVGCGEGVRFGSTVMGWGRTLQERDGGYVRVRWVG